MKPTTLYLIRHAQSLSNLNFEEGLGYLPETEFGSDLSELGEQQALELATELATIEFDAIYSSHLIRAEKTARAVAHRKKLAVTTVKELREGDEKTETEQLARERFERAVKEIVQKHPGETVAIVAHGFVIGTFLKQVGLPGPVLQPGIESLSFSHVGNTGYIQFEVADEQFVVKKTQRLKLNKVAVRAYQPADFDQLVKLMTSLQSFLVELDETHENKPLDSPQAGAAYIQQALHDVLTMNGATYVATVDTEVIGFVQGVIISHENDKLHTLTHHQSLEGWIGLFFIDPRFRGRGIGAALFDTIKKYFQEQHCTSLHLKVAHNNIRGIELYTKYGLLPTELEMSAKI